MAFPVSPTEGQTFTENNTVWIYSSTAQQWFRSQVNPENETFYEFGGSATATGNAGEIQYTDGTNLAASPNLVWDDVNDELEVGGDVVLDDGGTFTTTLQTVTPTQNRTISFPDATGTVGLVAGSSGNLVVNQSGAYAGVANSSVDNATGNVTLGSRFISTVNGAADASPVRISGTWFAGTNANSLPALYVSPTGTSAGTGWSTSGTGLGVNAPAAFGGNLLDLKVNGTSHFTVRGDTVTTATILQSNSISAGSGNFEFNSNGISATSVFRLGASYGAWDVVLARDAAGTLAQRNGTNAQTFRVYNTFTDASNYERGFLRWSSNVFEVGPEAAGTGTARPMRITAATLKLPNLPTYADNAAATTGGLVAGDVYKTATGELRITV
jgi:hypothetical protein